MEQMCGSVVEQLPSEQQVMGLSPGVSSECVQPDPHTPPTWWFLRRNVASEIIAPFNASNIRLGDGMYKIDGALIKDHAIYTINGVLVQRRF